MSRSEECVAQSWWVYIIRSRGGKLYTGITTDVDRRIREHRSGSRRGAKFFRTDPAEAVVFTESACSRSAASRREAAIKNMTRAEKLQLLGEWRSPHRNT